MTTPTRCEHDAPAWACRICCDPLTVWPEDLPEPRDRSRTVAILCLVGMVALVLLAARR